MIERILIGLLLVSNVALFLYARFVSKKSTYFMQTQLRMNELHVKDGIRLDEWVEDVRKNIKGINGTLALHKHTQIQISDSLSSVSKVVNMHDKTIGNMAEEIGVLVRTKEDRPVVLRSTIGKAGGEIPYVES